MFPHQNPVRTSCISHTCPNHTHLILLDVITQIILGVAWQTNHKAPRYAVFSKPATSFLLDPNIFLSTLDSNTISLCPSLNMTDQVAHPYKTTRKIMVLYIFIVLYSKLEDTKILQWMTAIIPSVCSKFLCDWNFDLSWLLPNIKIIPPCQRIFLPFGVVTLSRMLFSRHAHIHLQQCTCLLHSFLTQTLILHSLSVTSDDRGRSGNVRRTGKQTASFNLYHKCFHLFHGPSAARHIPAINKN